MSWFLIWGGFGVVRGEVERMPFLMRESRKEGVDGGMWGVKR